MVAAKESSRHVRVDSTGHVPVLKKNILRICDLFNSRLIVEDSFCSCREFIAIYKIYKIPAYVGLA